MATKKECDRCGEQWKVDEREKTCAVAVDVPYWTKQPYELVSLDKAKVAKTYELCQPCTRGAVMYLEHKDTIVQSS